MSEPLLCGRCGAPILAGAHGCNFCGVMFVGAPPAPQGVPSGVHGQVVALLRAGNKIEAIKVHRDHFKTSLRDAKNAVEGVEKGLGLG